MTIGGSGKVGLANRIAPGRTVVTVGWRPDGTVVTVGHGPDGNDVTHVGYAPDGHISNFGFEFVLTISWLNAPSMVISIVRRHPALLLGKQRFERADT